MSETRPVRRLLVLAPFAPRLDAVHGGSRTLAEFVAGLADRHQVGLFYLRAANEPEIDAAVAVRCSWTEQGSRPVAGPSLVGRLRRRISLLLGMVAGRPLWVGRWNVPPYGRRLREIVRSWRPEIVHLEYHLMGQYLDALEGCPAPRILTQYEPGFETAREAWRAARGASRVILGLDALVWRGFEREVLHGVQVVVTFTEGDRAAVSQLCRATPAVTIPRGTVPPDRPSNPAGTRPRNLLFVGNFVHPPNLEAARRLVSSILPLVQARIPDVGLTIVGDQPPGDLRALAGDHVRVTGRVPDLAPELEQAAVVVAPLVRGGGVRIKVLDALAAGKAIVASPLAVAGLDVRDGQEVVLARSDKEFADGIVGLLESEALRVALATRAREWAVANLRWEPSLRAYEELYDRLLASGDGAVGGDPGAASRNPLGRQDPDASRQLS